MRVLSTKKLPLTAREHLLHANIAVVHYDAIQINPLDFIAPKNIGNIIVASKNAAREILDKNISFQNCFCVGEKTSALLKKHGKNIIKTMPNALALGHYIVSKHPSDSFTFFCGKRRRDELPDILAKHNISLVEVPVYDTLLNFKKVPGSFDGILFFSPSAIESYVQQNSLKGQLVFCIGNTTAATAKQHTNTIIIANRPTIDNTIVQVINYFSNNEDAKLL
jgi:uroporphyrinogen-III synthase